MEACAAAVVAADLGVVDHAAGLALVELARRVDERKSGDNVSLPTFVKLLDALGLTPAARGELLGSARGGRGKPADGEGGGGVGADDAEPSSLARKRAELRGLLGGKAESSSA